jgi:hypothetical protein
MKIFKHKISGLPFTIEIIYKNELLKDPINNTSQFIEKGLYARPYMWHGQTTLLFNDIDDINVRNKFIDDNFIHISDIL